jgi:CRP/FNR family transcriptional regulator
MAMSHILHVPKDGALRAGAGMRGLCGGSRGPCARVADGENGREIVLYRVAPGDVCLQTFSALVHGAPYTAQGMAETDLEIEILPRLVPCPRGEDAAFRARLFARWRIALPIWSGWWRMWR